MVTTLVYRDQKLASQDPPLSALAALRSEPNVMLWVDLANPTDSEIKQILEETFGFHSLAIEDCVGDSPSPKLETYDEYLYLVMHAVGYAEAGFKTAELDLFLGKNYVVTFHREPISALTESRDRFIKNPALVVRGPDRFAYTILERMVDAYKPSLETLRSQVEQIEEGVLGSISARELFPKVVQLRKQLSRLRQIVRPQREIAAELARGKDGFIRGALLPYLRDLGEDLARIEAQAGAWAEQVILSFRIYLNKSGHEANEGIRVLTGITALTFPSLLISGWYGMNFSNMHELSKPAGYPLAIILTIGTTLLTYVLMRRRHWL